MLCNPKQDPVTIVEADANLKVIFGCIKAKKVLFKRLGMDNEEMIQSLEQNRCESRAGKGNNGTASQTKDGSETHRKKRLESKLITMHFQQDGIIE